MHGIERTRKATGLTEHGVGVARIVVRYSDGRVMNFVPDAGREAFSEDDMLEMKKVLERADHRKRPDAEQEARCHESPADRTLALREPPLQIIT